MKGGNGSSEINKSSEMDLGEINSASDAVRQVKNSNGDMEAQSAGTLVHQLSEASRREIEDLVGILMTYHKKLQTDGDRLQLDIEDYADLNQHVRQLTTNASDSVGKLPALRVN
jgi:hypothetical protein